MSYFKYNGHNIFYQEIGQGNPLILLHGNTASSKMFGHILDLYKEKNRIVLIDFLGHGQSDRLKSFPTDFWYDEAMQVIALIEKNRYAKVNLIGTSGGALAALNVALERGDLVNKVVADSFEGEAAVDSISECIPLEREQSKSQENGRMFWDYCHGTDWESIVDNDTAMVTAHNKTVKRFFHKKLSALPVPALLTASLEDEFAKAISLDFSQLYPAMAGEISNCRVHLFQSGDHPSMLTNAVEFANVVKAFFDEGMQ